jgi:HD-GYP domain-containing protein (c-di-GMP phosphodiesterase class II)
MTLQNLLLAFAKFRQSVQPEWYAHIHSHGHATARVARCFAATSAKLTQESTLDEIEFGAHMHDIGKYLIAKEILFKPDLLDEEERAIVLLHPGHGAEILSDLPCVTPTITQIVLYHHERWNGTGYPEGLAGNAIPLAARIVAIADVYTSLRAQRSYKPAYTRSGAGAVLREMAGNELDPDLVHDFLKFIGKRAKGERRVSLRLRPRPLVRSARRLS